MTVESRTGFTKVCPRCLRPCGAEDFYPGGYSVCRDCCLAGWTASAPAADAGRGATTGRAS